MTNWTDTDQAAKFIATGDSRETSPEIMKAIAFFARDKAEAEAIWNGDSGDLLSIWENTTGNGREDDTVLMWGDRTLAQVMADAE